MRNRLLKALANDTSVASPPRPDAGAGILLSFRGPGALGGGGGRFFLGLALLRCLAGGQLDQLDLPAGLLDLLARLRAHLVRAHGDGLGQIAVAEDLQPVPAVLERAGGQQPLDGHRLLGIDAFQVGHVDDGVLHPERVGEPPLGDAALDGHLPTLEADEVHVAGAGLLSLPAAAGRLAGPAGLSPAYPLPFLHSPTRRWSQSAQLVHLVSSNAASRCSLGGPPATYTQRIQNDGTTENTESTESICFSKRRLRVLRALRGATLLVLFRGSLGGFPLGLGEGAAAEGLELLGGLLHGEQVRDLGDHAADGRGVLEDALPAHLGEAQAAHGGAVVLGMAAEAADELHSQCRLRLPAGDGSPPAPCRAGAPSAPGCAACAGRRAPPSPRCEGSASPATW